MSLSRLTGWLVEPAVAPVGRPGTRSRPRAIARPPSVAVLAAPAEAPALAASLALRLAGGVGVVAIWTGAAEPGPRAARAAIPAARRLATALVARELAAAASGRLVTVALPAGGAAAASALARVEAVLADGCAVLAAAGPRDAALDGVLVERDLVLVHAGEDALAQLTLARLREQGARAERLDAAPGALARVLARAGLALPGGLRGLDDALAQARR